ncbi:MAG: redoxin domain-containing protein [Ignavibacterium sp.]|jgi:thiol-disulfide isomerase/thioredoxin
MTYPTAPELHVSDWINTPTPIRLTDLRGKVVLIGVFQMLCPGCILHGMPLAKKLHELFASDERIKVLGLHSVFEHHNAMQLPSLEAFLYEFRYTFPVGIDAHDDGPVPLTMRTYKLRGTPSLILIDRQGRVRESLFGQVDELALGVRLGELMRE